MADDGLWSDIRQTVVVTVAAGLLAEDAARATVEVESNGVVVRLAIAHESRQRMCGTPDADDGRIGE